MDENTSSKFVHFVFSGVSLKQISYSYFSKYSSTLMTLQWKELWSLYYFYEYYIHILHFNRHCNAKDTQNLSYLKAQSYGKNNNFVISLS